MPVISALSVVFIGVAGGGKIDQQVEQVIEAAHLTRAERPGRDGPHARAPRRGQPGASSSTCTSMA